MGVLGVSLLGVVIAVNPFAVMVAFTIGSVDVFSISLVGANELFVKDVWFIV